MTMTVHLPLAAVFCAECAAKGHFSWDNTKQTPSVLRHGHSYCKHGILCSRNMNRPKQNSIHYFINILVCPYKIHALKEFAASLPTPHKKNWRVHSRTVAPISRSASSSSRNGAPNEVSYRAMAASPRTHHGCKQWIVICQTPTQQRWQPTEIAYSLPLTRKLRNWEREGLVKSSWIQPFAMQLTCNLFHFQKMIYVLKWLSTKQQVPIFIWIPVPAQKWNITLATAHAHPSSEQCKSQPYKMVIF